SRLESDLLRRIIGRRVLIIASGGCAALSLARRYPAVSITAFDPSAEQLDHVRRKLVAASAGDRKALNVEETSRTGLNVQGRFEQLFASFQALVHRDVAPREAWLSFFRREHPLTELDALARGWTKHPAWAEACEASFGDPL